MLGFILYNFVLFPGLFPGLVFDTPSFRLFGHRSILNKIKPGGQSGDCATAPTLKGFAPGALALGASVLDQVRRPGVPGVGAGLARRSRSCTWCAHAGGIDARSSQAVGLAWLPRASGQRLRSGSGRAVTVLGVGAGSRRAVRVVTAPRLQRSRASHLVRWRWGHRCWIRSGGRACLVSVPDWPGGRGLAPGALTLGASMPDQARRSGWPGYPVPVVNGFAVDQGGRSPCWVSVPGHAGRSMFCDSHKNKKSDIWPGFATPSLNPLRQHHATV